MPEFVYDDSAVDKEFISSEEFEEFRKYIVTHCTSTPMDLSWLKKIVFEWNSNADYMGYWRADFDVSEGDIITDIEALIVLNLFYLRTLEELKRTFSHEYGHHWTLCYFAKSKNIKELNGTCFPPEYYSKRGLDDKLYFPDYSIAWHFCDKEVIAEDFRILFSPYKDDHQMVANPNNLEKPSIQIADFIWKLAKPSGWMS
jgi:hypothetical protein